MANRLANESSPYLLQHQDNPVDWYPWGEEALQRSKDEDKPIFLSVGYSACHWCHVMERESFESQMIADLLNENFVCIKVDREERPDIDQVYMHAVMALRGGQGGWPLSAFLTPDQQVFYGGTYWPPHASRGMPGFDHVIRQVADAFRTNRDSVEQQSRQITEFIEKKAADSADGNELPMDESLLLVAAAQLERNYDFTNGGFGGAPKFPHPMDLQLLLQLWRRWPEHLTPPRDQLLHMVELNLKKMAYGGIFDHLGGGFARYSVDEKWLVPHFEKMLYDNAQLAKLYLQMKQITGNEFFGMVARKTLDYLIDEMSGERGEFFSTEDADSEGEEGKYYVWTVEEVNEILGQELGGRFCEMYDITPSGNFEGKNIPNLVVDYTMYAEQIGVEKPVLRREMRDARASLHEARQRRVRPEKDDKVLVSWNALAIDAFATGYLVLGEETYRIAAARAAEFILSEMCDDRGRLLHTYRLGQAKQPAFLDDYAYLVNALLTLYSTDFNSDWIDRAMGLAEQMVDHFHDRDSGGFFFTADDQPQLFTRNKDDQDSSVPSGNAMAALAMIRLTEIEDRPEWREIAEGTLKFTGKLMHRAPMATGQSLVALERRLDDCVQLVLVVSQRDEKFDAAMDAIRAPWLPNAVVLLHDLSHPANTDPLRPLFDGKESIDGLPTLYVCRQHACAAPVSGQDAIETAMFNLAKEPKFIDGR